MTLLLFLDAWTFDARFKIWSKFNFIRGQMWSTAVKCGQTRLLIFILCKSRSNCRFTQNHIFQVIQNQSTYTFFDFMSLLDLSIIHFSVSAQEPLLDRHKNIYTIYSLCPFENTNRAVSFSMLRERVVSFDFSRILELCRRGIFSAHVLLTICTGLDNLQKYYVTSIT